MIQDILYVIVERVREKARKWPGMSKRKAVRPKRNWGIGKQTGTIAWYGGWVKDWRRGKHSLQSTEHVKLSYSIDGSRVDCRLEVAIDATWSFEIADPNSNRELDRLARSAHQIAQWMTQ